MMKVTETTPLFKNYVDDRSKQVPLNNFYSSFDGLSSSRSNNTRNQQKSLTGMKITPHIYSWKLIAKRGS